MHSLPFNIHIACDIEFGMRIVVFAFDNASSHNHLNSPSSTKNCPLLLPQKFWGIVFGNTCISLQLCEISSANRGVATYSLVNPSNLAELTNNDGLSSPWDPLFFRWWCIQRKINVYSFGRSFKVKPSIEKNCTLKMVWSQCWCQCTCCSTIRKPGSYHILLI